jgi:hypothetical protein
LILKYFPAPFHLETSIFGLDRVKTVPLSHSLHGDRARLRTCFFQQAKEALSSEKKLDEVLALPFEPLVQIELRVIVAQIRSLNQSIGELDRIIGEEGSKLEGHKNLTSIKGIGKITGAISLHKKL